MDLSPIELVGYAGSLLVLTSLTRTSLLQLRIIGLAGAVTFFVYGMLIAAYPIAIVNLAIVGVHLYFLRQLLSRTTEFFTSLEINKDSQYLRHFLDFHRTDIQSHQPGFEFHPSDRQVRAFVLRDTIPAGLFIGRVCSDDSIEVELDYVVPQYRDFKVAEFLYSDRSQIFSRKDRRTIWARRGSLGHVKYFEELGFVPATVHGESVLLANLDSVLGE